jgi:hypothetical protein
VDERLDALKVEAWTNPGAHTKAELDDLVKLREELIEETAALIADVEATSKSNEEKRFSSQEQLRAVWGREYDLQKHVTTLSTASILGLGALTNFFPATPSLGSAAPSLIAFLLAIILAIAGMAGSNLEILGVSVKPKNKPTHWLFRASEWIVRNGFGLCRMGSLIAFCLGVSGIVLFVLEHA